MTAASGYRRTIPLMAFCLLALVIPLPFIYSAIGTGLAVIAGVLLRIPVVFRNYSHRKILWFWTALYIWFASSWLWNIDTIEANSDLGTKLPMLLLPVAIGSSGLISRPNLQKIACTFTTGLVGVAGWCIWHAWHRYQISGDIDTLFYHQLVSGLEANAVYVSWYTITALLFLLLEPVTIPFFRYALIRLVLILALLPFFFMLAARTLILYFLIIGLPVALLYSFRKGLRLSNRLLVWVTVVLVGSTAGLAFRNPVIQTRFQALENSQTALSFLKQYHGEEHQFSNLNIRLFLWRVGIECIVNDPHIMLRGTGVGDVHAVTNARIRSLGIAHMDENDPKRSPFYNINLHNTFIHLGVVGGVPALLLFLVAVLAPAGMAIRYVRSYPFDFTFHLASLVFMMQEAVFQTQAGAIFYSAFCCLLLDFGYNRQKEICKTILTVPEPLDRPTLPPQN